MSVRQAEIYICNQCGTEAEGAEFEGHGPAGWLSLEHWDDSSSVTSYGDFCSKTCLATWSTKDD